MSSGIAALTGARVAYAAPAADVSTSAPAAPASVSADPAPAAGSGRPDAPAPGPVGDPNGGGGLVQNPDGTVTLPDGRKYVPSTDPATGHMLLTHHSEQTAPNGNVLQLDIQIDLAPDQSFARTVKQHLQAPNGDFQQDATRSSFDAAGQQVGEVTDARTKAGGKDQSEHTVTSFTAGVATHRESQISQVQVQDTPGTGEHAESRADVKGIWDNGGQPISDQTVPTIDRTEQAKYVTPKQGINTDTDRVITTKAHAVGPLNNVTYDGPLQLVVRFNGHGSQYIERELSVPINAQGQPDMTAAKVVRTDDHESAVTKGMTQARIWGGFASNIMAVVGINLLRGNLSGLGRGLMFGGIAAGGAEMVGEGHAIATKRNDASWSRLFMAAYDTTWLGLLTHATRGRTDITQPSASTLNMGTALGVGGAALSMGRVGSDLTGSTNLGALRHGTLATPNGDLRTALTFLNRPVAPELANGSWRPVPRFDAAAQLLGS